MLIRRPHGQSRRRGRCPALQKQTFDRLVNVSLRQILSTVDIAYSRYCLAKSAATYQDSLKKTLDCLVYCRLSTHGLEEFLGAAGLRHLALLGVLFPEVVVLPTVVLRHVVVELVVQLTLEERELGRVHHENLFRSHKKRSKRKRKRKRKDVEVRWVWLSNTR